ncbi:MAG: NAD(P)H-binding protein, partial [Ignavibacteriaceae bacterium]|nr:NAD(P)H-binding protein [Ignavibacteriaceae bacterium]
MKTAIVIGATGLIGKHLTKLLLDNPDYSTIRVFARRSINISNSKLAEHIVDFDEIDKWKSKIIDDDLFSAMGTTIKKAGSKEAQYKIDVAYQFDFAKAASENGVKNYFLVSSSGANDESKFFYMKIKGHLEEKVKLLPFNKIRI